MSRIKDAYGDERKYYDVLELLRCEKARAEQSGVTEHSSYYWYLDVTEGDGYITLQRRSKSKKAKYALYKAFLDNFRMDVDKELVNKQIALSMG